MITRILLIGIVSSAACWAQSPALGGIAHAAFRVSDVERSREFYRKLGFEQAFEFTKEGKTTEAFIKINDRQFVELYPRTADSQPLGLMHLCFEAGDLAALHDEYIKRELKASAAKKGGAGNLMFSIHDPEGQLIEYTQYLPGSLHFEDHGKHLSEHRVSQQLLSAVVLVKNLADERTFYTDKLAFKASGNGDAAPLRLAGDSDQQIELQSAGPESKPGLVFATADVRHTADELRSRGLTVRASRAEVSASDPDGVVIFFRRRTSH